MLTSFICLDAVSMYYLYICVCCKSYLLGNFCKKSIPVSIIMYIVFYICVCGTEFGALGNSHGTYIDPVVQISLRNERSLDDGVAGYENVLI